MRCLLLCSMLGVSAWAGQPTRIEISSTAAQIGQPVTIRAAVYDRQSGSPIFGGTVAFTSNGVTIEGCGAVAFRNIDIGYPVAVCVTEFPTLGTFTIGAAYSGSVGADPVSGTISLPVAKLFPSAYLASSPAAPVYGGGLIVNALVLGAQGMPAPTGTFTFSDAAVALVTRAVDADGRAALGMPLNAGRHTIQAVYNGDDYYLSRSSGTIDITVSKGTPVVAVSSTPAQIGQPVTITASVLPAGAGGSIAFSGAPGCAAVPVASGVATCGANFTQLGDVGITATYSGDANLTGGAASMRITVGKAVPGVYAAFTPSAPVYGDAVTLSALVLGSPGVGAPAGTVTFAEAGSALAPAAPLDSASGRATAKVALGVGSHAIQAIYSGDANYQAVPPVAMNVTVGKAAPVVAISATPAQIDQPVIVTVSITAPSPTGTVDFAPIAGCSGVPVLKGKAECSAIFPQLGDFTVIATYSGDANTRPGSASLKLKVGKVVAGVFVTHSPTAPVYGDRVRIGALVLGAPGVAAPTGTMTFTDWTTPATATVPLDADGRASWTAALATGARPITATYNGDANYGTSAASTLVVVGKAGTTTTLTAVTGGPFTATVGAAAGSGIPTGVVRFLRGGAPIATVALAPAGAAAWATLASSAETGVITAEYTGDANFTGSTSAAAVVAAPRAEVRLASDHNPAPVGSVTFTASVVTNSGGAAPTGAVQFGADGASIGSAVLVGGAASVTVTLKVGTHTITASYSGDAVYPASSASLSQIVNATAASLTLTASAPAVVYGEPVTVTAQLPAGAAGAVQFSDGATPLGSRPLASGAASLTLALAAGTHVIAASWPGDAAWGAASAQLFLVVNKARTATTLSLSAGVAIATVAAAGAGSPTGSVSFLNAATGASLASVPLTGGVAAATLPRTADLVFAAYAGDDNFLGSTSAPCGELVAANAASYGSAAFAADEIVTLFGPNLAGAASAKVTDSAGVARPADVLYAAAQQASIVMPADLATGPATVTIGDTTGVLTIARTAPGLFTQDASGGGAPVAQVLRVHADGTQESGAADTVEVGENETVYLVLYGTGIRHAETVGCTIGGRSAGVVFAGAQGGFSGLDQVNVAVPASLKGAGAVTLVVTADGVASNAVTVTFR